MANSELDLDRWYREYRHVVLRRARDILGSDAEANEILQTMFASLVERPEQYRGHSSVTTFLYAATTNACLNRLRSTKRRAELLDGHARSSTAPDAARPDDAIAARQLLARLPERLAKVAIYYYVDEMSHEEIAQILGLSRRHVGNLVDQLLEEARQ